MCLHGRFAFLQAQPRTSCVLLLARWRRTAVMNKAGNYQNTPSLPFPPLPITPFLLKPMDSPPLGQYGPAKSILTFAFLHFLPPKARSLSLVFSARRRCACLELRCARRVHEAGVSGSPGTLTIAFMSFNFHHLIYLIFLPLTSLFHFLHYSLLARHQCHIPIMAGMLYIFINLFSLLLHHEVNGS